MFIIVLLEKKDYDTVEGHARNRFIEFYWNQFTEFSNSFNKMLHNVKDPRQVRFLLWIVLKFKV